MFQLRGPWIYALVAWILPDRNIAEQLVIEVFWRASQNARVMTLGPTALSAWLRIKARSLAVDSLRSKKPVIAHPAAFRSECLQGAPGLSSLSLALVTLAPHEREVFELAYFEGLSHSEIAEITGRSLGTIKTWVRTSRLRVAHTSESDQMQSDAHFVSPLSGVASKSVEDKQALCAVHLQFNTTDMERHEEQDHHG